MEKITDGFQQSKDSLSLCEFLLKYMLKTLKFYAKDCINREMKTTEVCCLNHIHQLIC